MCALAFHYALTASRRWLWPTEQSKSDAASSGGNRRIGVSRSAGNQTKRIDARAMVVARRT